MVKVSDEVNQMEMEIQMYAYLLILFQYWYILKLLKMSSHLYVDKVNL